MLLMHWFPHWFLFIAAILVALFSVFVGFGMRAASKEAAKTDPIEGIGVWDVLSGNALKKIEQNMNAEGELKGTSWFAFLVALAAAAFAVYQGVQIWGTE